MCLILVIYSFMFQGSSSLVAEYLGFATGDSTATTETTEEATEETTEEATEE